MKEVIQFCGFKAKGKISGRSKITADQRQQAMKLVTNTALIFLYVSQKSNMACVRCVARIFLSSRRWSKGLDHSVRLSRVLLCDVRRDPCMSKLNVFEIVVRPLGFQLRGPLYGCCKTSRPCACSVSIHPDVLPISYAGLRTLSDIFYRVVNYFAYIQRLATNLSSRVKQSAFVWPLRENHLPVHRISFIKEVASRVLCSLALLQPSVSEQILEIAQEHQCLG